LKKEIKSIYISTHLGNGNKAQQNVIVRNKKSFGYKADTEPGSSGSPVFFGGKLAGLHHGCVEKKGNAHHNEAINMSLIVEWLKEKFSNMLNEIDENDKTLIRILKKKNKSIPEISRKLKLSILLVRTFIESENKKKEKVIVNSIKNNSSFDPYNTHNWNENKIDAAADTIIDVYSVENWKQIESPKRESSVEFDPYQTSNLQTTTTTTTTSLDPYKTTLPRTSLDERNSTVDPCDLKNSMPAKVWKWQNCTTQLEVRKEPNENSEKREGIVYGTIIMGFEKNNWIKHDKGWSKMSKSVKSSLAELHFMHSENLEAFYSRFDPKKREDFTQELDEFTGIEHELWQNLSKTYKDALRSAKIQNALTAADRETSKKITSVKKMNMQKDSVCKIQYKGKSLCGSGFLVNYMGRMGIMTNNHVFGKLEDCGRASAIFRMNEATSNKQQFKLEFEADKFFWTNHELDVTFVACQHEIAVKQGIEPWNLLDSEDVHPGEQIHIYQHPDGRPKERSRIDVFCEDKKKFGYNADTEGGSSGSPVFCGGKLVGLHHGVANMFKNDKHISYNEAIRISSIIEALLIFLEDTSSNFRQDDKEFDKEIVDTLLAGGMSIQIIANKLEINLQLIQEYVDSKQTFSIGEEVMAKWEDGHEYKAKIKKKITKGYQVHYYEFGEVFSDLPVHKIKRFGTKRVGTKKFVEESTKNEVKTWLKSIELEKYFKNFKENDYGTMKTINSLTPEEINNMIVLVGCSKDDEAKIKKALKIPESPSPYLLPKNNFSMLTLTNRPMSRGWKPAKNDVDLTDKFLNSDGSCSVSLSIKQMEADIRKNGTTNFPICYVWSSKKGVYFQIQAIRQ